MDTQQTNGVLGYALGYWVCSRATGVTGHWGMSGVCSQTKSSIQDIKTFHKQE